MKTKTWTKIVLGGTVFILVALAIVTIVIDPFLHYHTPLNGLAYPLKDERYLNNGISKHYDYDAIITGTSMTQNFKPSEFDQLFDCTTIKLSYSGASYKEVNDNMLRALSYNPDVKYIFRSLDSTVLNYSADYYSYNGYPEYFYDKNPFNDVNYLLNKEVIPKTLEVLNYTRAGNTTPTWDEYGNWSNYRSFGAYHVFQTLPELPTFSEELILTDTDYQTIRENVQQNIIDTALAYPDIEFYLFIPPYSICYYESLVKTKQWSAQLDAELFAVEMLLETENIHVFNFAAVTDITTDLSHYTDTLHYGEWINSYIAECMSKGENELTKDNYKQYFEELYSLYQNYDYSTIYDQEYN